MLPRRPRCHVRFLPPAFCRPLSAAFNATLVTLAFCLALPGLATPAVSPSAPVTSSLPTVPWDKGRQGGFVTALTGDRQGNIWAGTENNGLARFDPASKQWTQFTAKSTNGGLGDDDIYSLACDKLGRIWAGTGRDGVSVWSGRQWKTYDRLIGPLGCHVVALATSPLTGDVWGCTEAGIFDYALKANAWRYFTRADGLPSDQATCLAFTHNGTLVVGTDCDGVAIGSPANNYKTWRVVKGPDAMPASLRGDGLPSSLINCLLVSRTGTVYAGTTDGLARSADGGQTWRFVRGADWKDKLAGMYHPITPQGDGKNSLLEDYVTALAEDGAGRLYVSHRQKGLEVLDPVTGERQDDAKVVYGGFVDALLPTSTGRVLIGTYGDGLRQTEWPAPPAPVTGKTKAVLDLPLPAPAPPPTAASLSSLLTQVRALKGPLPVGRASYLGEDWATQGDWVGRYGRQFALLFAMQSPWGDHVPINADLYDAHADIGPHHASGDSLRHWVSWVKTDNLRSLYDPLTGYRRQASDDDHAEKYPLSYDGPDVWVYVCAAAGLHRVSLYFFNYDGHSDNNSIRDYMVEVKPYRKRIEEAQALPTLAHARVRCFWGGVYESFLIQGPEAYYIRIGKNNSKNTVCSAVFIDKISGVVNEKDDMPTELMGEQRYDPPDPSVQPTTASLTTSSPSLRLARSLWAALDNGYDSSASFALQQPYRILAYRSAVNAGDAEDLDYLLSNWRWKLNLWTPPDRQEFDDTMALARKSFLDIYGPRFASGF